jgi:aspartate/glutamate racemase
MTAFDSKECRANISNLSTNPESRRQYIEIISRLIDSGAEGIILGCPEIELLVQLVQKDC